MELGCGYSRLYPPCVGLTKIVTCAETRTETREMTWTGKAAGLRLENGLKLGERLRLGKRDRLDSGFLMMKQK